MSLINVNHIQSSIPNRLMDNAYPLVQSSPLPHHNEYSVPGLEPQGHTHDSLQRSMIQLLISSFEQLLQMIGRLLNLLLGQQSQPAPSSALTHMEPLPNPSTEVTSSTPLPTSTPPEITSTSAADTKPAEYPPHTETNEDLGKKVEEPTLKQFKKRIKKALKEGQKTFKSFIKNFKKWFSEMLTATKQK